MHYANPNGVSSGKPHPSKHLNVSLVRVCVLLNGAAHSYAASYAEQTAWFNSDFYGVLGVSSDVDSSQLKKVYRKLARSFHPDKYDSSGPEVKDAYSKESSSAF